jgi:hypothetical protein
MTSPHCTVWFGVRQGPQLLPHAVADVPLLVSLPAVDRKYVCSGANADEEDGVDVGVGVAVGFAVALGVVEGLGVAVGVPVAVAVDVACGVGVGVAAGAVPPPDVELPPPPPHAPSISPHTSDAIRTIAPRALIDVGVRVDPAASPRSRPGS